MAKRIHYQLNHSTTCGEAEQAEANDPRNR